MSENNQHTTILNIGEEAGCVLPELSEVDCFHQMPPSVQYCTFLCSVCQRASHHVSQPQLRHQPPLPVAPIGLISSSKSWEGSEDSTSGPLGCGSNGSSLQGQPCFTFPTPWRAPFPWPDDRIPVILLLLRFKAVYVSHPTRERHGGRRTRGGVSASP